MDLSIYALELAKNSIKAQAKKIDIIIDENVNENYISIKVIDNGHGIEKEKLEVIRRPFKKNEISLGIPMLQQVCNLCNGNLSISSDINNGTAICATMEYNNIDRPPLGDTATTISKLLASNPQVNFKYIHKYNDKKYIFDVDKIKGIMNDIQLGEPAMIAWIKDTINEGVSNIKS